MEKVTNETDRAKVERLANLAKRDQEPSPNPRYRGMTVREVARALLRPTKPAGSKSAKPK